MSELTRHEYVLLLSIPSRMISDWNGLRRGISRKDGDSKMYSTSGECSYELSASKHNLVRVSATFRCTPHQSWLFLMNLRNT